MLELHQGALNINDIESRWLELAQKENCGAFIKFVGIVRDEDSIDGLSFDLYEPILRKWFDSWQTQAQEQNTKLFMAHSIGDVLLGESSYIAAVLSPKRRVALEMIDAFVEDFKANAPIWKYDLKDGKRIYAEERSHKIEGSGILG